MSKKRVAIIGAGITGLTTAWKAEREGADVDLFDRKATAGGVIRTENKDGWRYELGPNTLLLKDREVEEMIGDLGLENRVRIANRDASKRFIVKNGSLVQLPQSLSGFLKTPLFSGGAKARLLKEPFISRTNEGATIAEFFQQRFGKEVLDYAVNPFIAGIYAGRPDKLSIKHAFPSLHELEQEYGSVVYGGLRKAFNRNGKKQKKTRRRLISFETGLSELQKSLLKGISNRFLGDEVQQTMRREDGWILTTSNGSFGPYHDIVVTIPLHKWNSKTLPLTEEQLNVIRNVEYPPLSMMILGFKKEDIQHPLDGFGFLMPEVEERSILGALFTSTLFENRAPEGHHLLTVFAGGGRQPDIGRMESNELLKLITGELNELIGLNGNPVYKDHIFWPHSIPQYDVDYGKIHNIFESLEASNSGLHIAGNFRQGISVPDCIKNGLKLGKSLAKI